MSLIECRCQNGLVHHIESGIINAPQYEWHRDFANIDDFHDAWHMFESIDLLEKYSVFRRAYPEAKNAIAVKCLFVEQFVDGISVSFSMIARRDFDYEDWIGDL